MRSHTINFGQSNWFLFSATYIKVPSNNFFFGKRPLANNSSKTTIALEVFMDEISQSCRDSWFFSWTKPPKFWRNYQLRFFNQLPGSTLCNITVGPTEQKTDKGNCYEVQNPMNRPDKQTWFFSKQSTRSWLSRSQSGIFHL